jgi:hypothetical protein
VNEPAPTEAPLPAKEIKSELPPTQHTPTGKSRPKSTINLGALRAPAAKSEETPEKKNGAAPPDEPVTESRVREVWNEFAEQRKDQVAAYHLLTQSLQVHGTTLTLSITNPVEEPLLQQLKPELLAFLREQLRNNAITVTGSIQPSDAKRRPYSSKEKFDYLAEKNPLLKELKERLGLDLLD